GKRDSSPLNVIHLVKPLRLILASSSPYRQALLSRLQLPFESVSPSIDETAEPGESPARTALRLARQKAQAVQATHPDCLIVGSDQVATLDDRQIGKPGSHQRALEQLRLMRGRQVVFHTALCLLDARRNAPQPLQLEEIR